MIISSGRRIQQRRRRGRRIVKIRTCPPVRVSLRGTYQGLPHAATEEGDGHSPLRPSSSPEGGGAIEEGGAKTMIGGGGGGVAQYGAATTIVAGGAHPPLGGRRGHVPRHTFSRYIKCYVISKCRPVMIKSARRSLHESTSARWHRAYILQ